MTMGDAGGELFGFDVFEHLEAAHDGHVDVAHDEGDGVLAEEGEGFGSVGCLEDGFKIEARHLEGAEDYLSHHGRVVDHQNCSLHAVCSLGLRLSCLAAGREPL